MELKLEVVLSSSIKRKKPWPRFCWLGQEKESVFLLDDKRISEINMVSGRTKKRTPKLNHLLNSVVTMASSHNGLWLCGLLSSGELFLWNKDKDLLKIAAAVLEVTQAITSTQGIPPKFSVQVSGDGKRVLLVAKTGEVFLWECEDVKDLTGLRDGPVKGRWAHMQPLESTVLPSSQDKEAAHHIIFVKTEGIGDTCLLAFVFTSGKKLIITFLRILWEEGQLRQGSVGYSIQWATKTYPLSHLTPPCQVVKSRGALVPAFSPDGKLLAIVLNQRKPKATQILYVSTQNFVSLSSDLGGCGSTKTEIPSKYIRSYWVGSVSWSPGGLFLACVLKRGSLLMVARLGGLLTLSSSGCSVDFGPAHFLPLHPLVTYRPPISAGRGDASRSSSSLSVRDVLRQRYSVTWHPKLLYLIVSDGYLATVLKVLDRPSPGLVLKALLKDVSKDLKKASQMLDKSQIHAKSWLESVSNLNLDSSLEQLNPTPKARPNATDSFISAATDGSTLPLFLQDQRSLGGTKELFESVQAFFEDDSDIDGLPMGSHAEDGGRLEFASMFDTIHAQDTHPDAALVTRPDDDEDFIETENKVLLYCELKKVQNRLLTAWAFGMSLGNAIEHRARLLKHILCCVVQFSALLHWITHSTVNTGENETSPKLLHLLKSLLSFLSWDSTPSDGPCCLGLMVEFIKQLIRLLLTPQLDFHDASRCQLSSQSLLEALHVLQMVSDSLDQTYNLQQKTHWSFAEKGSPSQPPQLWLSDVHHVSLLQEEEEERSSCVVQSRPAPQRPSSRLVGVYRMMYNITKQYVDELERFAGCDGWEEEVQQLSVIMSQIQTAVQATGGRLEERPPLLSYPGEHLYLSGSYSKSAHQWQLQICEENNKSCDRSVFQVKRLCLALLYSLLSQYHLKEAQELGDHMAQLVLYRAGHLKSCPTADSLPCPWLPAELHTDAACAVIQTLGRFMASYFTNQPLYILPPHNVAVLPPLHIPHDGSFGRLVPLSQEEVAKAVRQQHLSEVWTVDYAQDLLLLGGLLPEAVWLAYNLGDWKTAVSLSLAYTSYCTDHFDFPRLRRRALHLPADLKPERIFQKELECLLCNGADSSKSTDTEDDNSLTDLVDGIDWDHLQVSIQEILKASVIAGVNVISSPVSSLLDAAKDLCSSLPALVPAGLYLPAPPLYCPQPSPNTQDQIRKMGQFAEVACRHKVSGVLQRLLLLLRSGYCCYPAAQWYVSHLRRARHLLYKIKKKYPYPAEEEKTLPEGLMKLITRRGYFKRGPNKDSHLDPDTIQIIICFRELCAICWMLHVRDQLSLSCRRYQVARQHIRDEQLSSATEVNSACADALRWACRFLPFSRFLNAEEILQDILLSLVSELPPVPLVAETLVRAFPEEEESVRVPLRDKYNSLVQRLRQCAVIEEEKEEESELMMILIQDKFRQRKKHLGRLRRHMAPRVLHLWEKEEEEEDGGSKHRMAMLRQLSLSTSLSTSTLANYGFPTVCSDGDTAENMSEAISPEQQSRVTARDKRAKKVKERGRTKKRAVKIKNVIQEETHQGNAKDNHQPSLPVVGTWEFELEDEEYSNFLELFLSYVLEKDRTDAGDFANEPPLMKDFCSEIRERELHSLAFDVLTTIHRRQRDGHHPARKHSSIDPPVFRAGCCYKPVKQGATPEPHTSSFCKDAPVSGTSFSINSQPPWRTGEQKGLFGLRQRSSVPSNQKGKENLKGFQNSQSGLITGKISDSFVSGSSVNVEAVTELQQGLDPKLEAEFPKLGRLLEWMVRWADRRALVGHLGKKKKDAGGRVADEGVVIRVKASAPAILTSLSLLEERLRTLLGTDRYSAHVQVPQVQCIVAPVLRPEGDRPPERESSGDMGDCGSANTPIIVLDHNLQQEEQSNGSFTDESEELTCPSMPLPLDQDLLTCDAQLRQSDLQQPFFDDLDVTPEKEGSGSRSEGLGDLSSYASENISGDFSVQDMSLKLADLDCTGKDEDTSSSTSLHSDAGNVESPPRQEVPAPPVDQGQTSFQIEVSRSIKTAEPPNVPACSSTHQAPVVDPTGPNQPSDTVTPPLRQNLGEDLFRLIQHINFMSLREVLQSSFTNMQLAQQSSSLPQSNMLPSHPNVPLSSTPHFIPEPNASAIQPTISEILQTKIYVPKSVSSNPQISQPPECVLAHQPAMQSSVKTSSARHEFDTNIELPSASVAGMENEEIQPLSVLAGSPDSPVRRSRGLIPSSQGLLATTDASLLSNISAPNDSTPQIMGLKLLQLHQPPSSQQSAHYPSTLKHYDKTASVNREGDKKGGSSALRSCQPNVWQPEQPRTQEVSVLPSLLPAPTTAPVQGLRLLQFNPERPQSNISFPNLPSATSFRPPTVIAAPMTGTSGIKLLHIESGPKMMLPAATPSTQMSHLMSLEELSRSVTGRQSAEGSGLLRVDPPNESTPSTVSSSSKRHKKREKVAKSEVTFRPNDSIIPTEEPSDVPEVEQPAVAEEISSGKDVSVPFGRPESVLTGQRLLDKAMFTSAKLHAFAATCKRPPDCHDAYTNTDPDSPPVFVDKAVSAQIAALANSLKSQGSFQISNENPVQDAGKTPREPESVMDLGGRQFISVLDLEDVRQHQDLLQSPRSGAQAAPASCPPSPSPAQLHFLATSVIRKKSSAAAAADDSQPTVTVAEDFLKPTTHPGGAGETPSVSHNSSWMVSERVASPEELFVHDLSHSGICQAIKAVSAEPHITSSSPAIWFSSHLSHLDGQLATLQNIADQLEMDFSDSKLMVNTIDKLTATEAPDVKTTTPAKKTVRLSVPAKAWAPRPDPDHRAEMTIFEEDENQEDDVFDREASGLRENISLGHSTYPHSHRADLSSSHTTPRTKDHVPEADDISHAWSDEYLGQTQLCDTVEMLDELVKEGYLSPTDMDLSTWRTPHQSRILVRSPQQPQCDCRLQKRALPVEERRELRMWMRKKQRERRTVYQKQRESLREREYQPFSSSAAVQSTNRNRKSVTRGSKKEKEILLEQYKQRAREAWILASPVLTSPGTQRRPLQLDGPSADTTMQTTSAPPSRSTQRPSSASDRRSLRSQRSQVSPEFRPSSAYIHYRPFTDFRKRLGLHRPVSVLPKDRLSQLTKRGMLATPKGATSLHTAGESEERSVGHQKKTGFNKTFSRGATGGRGILAAQTREEEVDALAGLLEQRVNSSRAGVSRVDLLDETSGSGSSCLSKIDWNDIEKMVAAEEEEEEVSK